MSEELTIRGTLEESSLPELLRSVTKSRESGVLTCYVEEHMKSIYVRDGQILFAHSSNMDERLGETLLKDGKITVRQFMDAAWQVKPGRRLGAVLCESKAITPEELVDGVRKQVRSIILSLFEATSGRYELSLKEIDTHEMITLNMSTEDVIFNGVKAIRSWTRINRGIGSFTSKVFPSPESGKLLLNLTMSPEESDIFSLCEKGHFTIEDVCSMSYLSNFETCRLVWAFLMCGVLETAESRGEETPLPAIYSTSADSEYELHELVENYNDLYSFIYDYAYERIGDEAPALSGRAMKRVQEAMPTVAKGLDLDSYGRLDFDAVQKNLASVQEAGRLELVTGVLEEIVYSLLFEVGAKFGPEQQKTLTLEIRKLRKR